MKCPKCGGELNNVDTLVTEWENNAYYDYCTGDCYKCHKTYWWTEVYVFDRCIDLEERDNDNDE